MDKQKTSRVVLISGCSSGLGEALATEFLRLGHKVVATARRVEGLQGLSGTGLFTTQLDVTDASSIDQAIASAFFRREKWISSSTTRAMV